MNECYLVAWEFVTKYASSRFAKATRGKRNSHASAPDKIDWWNAHILPAQPQPRKVKSKYGANTSCRLTNSTKSCILSAKAILVKLKYSPCRQNTRNQCRIVRHWVAIDLPVLSTAKPIHLPRRPPNMQRQRCRST